MFWLSSSQLLALLRHSFVLVSDSGTSKGLWDVARCRHPCLQRAVGGAESIMRGVGSCCPSCRCLSPCAVLRPAACQPLKSGAGDRAPQLVPAECVCPNVQGSTTPRPSAAQGDGAGVPQSYGGRGGCRSLSLPQIGLCVWDSPNLATELTPPWVQLHSHGLDTSTLHSFIPDDGLCRWGAVLVQLCHFNFDAHIVH